MSQAKRNLRKYNRVPKQNFHLFLKDCEFRFNYGPPKEQLQLLKPWLKQQGIVELSGTAPKLRAPALIFILPSAPLAFPIPR